MKRTPYIAVILGLAISGAGAAAMAHEMFLKPSSHYVAPNAKTTLALFNGTFDESDNPVTRDRMVKMTVLANGKETPVTAGQWRDDDVTSYLDLSVGGPGTYVVGVSTLPRIIAMSADDFDGYLKHDGIEDTLAARTAAKVARTPVKERYSKHVRAIVQVGDTMTDDFSKPLGFPAEILLLKNPASVKVGDTLGFKALFKGKPMANQLVYASYSGFHGHDAAGADIKAVRVRTNAAGEGTFTMPEKGRWYLTLINMQKTTGETDYESNWSTVTFEVR